jgi:predicted heme/steroid binding protein
VTKNIAIVTFVGLILGFAMIGGALYWLLGSMDGSTTTSSSNSSSSGGSAVVDESVSRSYTLEELALYDGKDGNDCLVAVDGDVYLIEGFALWVAGEHVTSGGRARCGFDLTEVIDESPHGRSKLELLKKVGTLE